jgi:hypothetical protein
MTQRCSQEEAAGGQHGKETAQAVARRPSGKEREEGDDAGRGHHASLAANLVGDVAEAQHAEDRPSERERGYVRRVRRLHSGLAVNPLQDCTNVRVASPAQDTECTYACSL